MQKTTRREAIEHAIITSFVATFITPILRNRAEARDPDGRYANEDPARREWFKNLKRPFMNSQGVMQMQDCCGLGDAVPTKFSVARNPPWQDQWSFFNTQTNKWQRVPEDIIMWDKVSPDGQGYLFASSDQSTLYCFVPPSCDQKCG